MADILSLLGQDFTTVELTHPVSGLPIGGSVTIWGIYSDKFPEAVQAFFARGGDGDPLQSPGVIAAMTKAFNDLDEGGVPFDISQAERIYSTYSVIRRQVVAALRDQRNFFPKPATAQPSS